MAKKNPRPFAQRDTSLSPPGEMLRRRLFLADAVAGGAGLVPLIAGLVKHRPPVAIAGATGLAANAITALINSDAVWPSLPAQ